MSLFVVSKCRLLIKPYGENYLEILFKNFVKEFDISDDNQIWWLSLLSFVRISRDFKVNDKDKYDIIISKLKL